MKALYWIRKLLGPVLVLIWMTIYIILMFKGLEKYSTTMIIILLLVVLVTMSLYPKKQVYCKCGNRWYKKIALKNTTETKKQDKQGNIKTSYVHIFECTCTCQKCGRVLKYDIRADGGYQIEKPDGTKDNHRIKYSIYLQNKDLLNR